MPAIGANGGIQRGASLPVIRQPAPAPPPPRPAQGGLLQKVGASLAHVAPVMQRAVQSTASPHQVSLAAAISRPAPAHSGNLFGRTTPHPMARVVSQPPFAKATLDNVLRRVWQGPDRAFLAPTDPILSPVQGFRGYTVPVDQLAVRNQFNQDFANLQKGGFLPKGATLPPLDFPARGAGRYGLLSYETPAQGSKPATVHISKMASYAATHPSSYLSDWGQKTLIHELAHTMQAPQAVAGSRALTEGGAQAYTDAVTPAVLGPMPNRDTNYTDFVKQVRAMGPAWYMRKQFTGGTPVVRDGPIAMQSRRRG